MGEPLTMIAPAGGTRRAAGSLPPGYTERPCRSSDVAALGRLYYEAYEPGVACATLEEAFDDVRASFDGAYGELWPAASPVVHHGDDLVAAALTVQRAPWERTPDCPFVIELFTDRAHRRRGLARALVERVLVVAREAGGAAVALRVDAKNAAARALYERVGFRAWHGGGGPA